MELAPRVALLTRATSYKRPHVIVLARYGPSEVCLVSPLQKEGSGAPTGARVQRHPSGGPIVAHMRFRAWRPAQTAHAVRAPGTPRLSALHRGDFLAPDPPWPDR